MFEATERIKRLRSSALQKDIPDFRSDEAQLLWLRGWVKAGGAGSNAVRRAQAQAYMLSRSTAVIDDGELIVGKPSFAPLSPQEQQELDAYRQQYAAMAVSLDGQASHMAVDYEKLLSLGLEGIEAQIRAYRRALSPDEPEDLAKDEFYQACLISLEGVSEYARHYAEQALALSLRCEDAQRKRELAQIARTLTKVPRGPAGNFREAMQSIHFITYCLCAGPGMYQLGRPDRYLIDYYRRDIEGGGLTPGSALELIDCVCILFNEYVPKGYAIGLMVGGRDASGIDVTNELSRLFIESIAHTRMIYPGVGLCYHEDTPRDILIRSMELLAEGLSQTALFNDDVIIRGLRGYGLPDSQACLYTHSTCVEITPVASSAVWVASPYLNLPQLLLDMLGIGPLDEAGGGGAEPPEYADYDAFKREYRRRLAEKIGSNAREQNLLQMERSLHGGDALVSCFVNDCLARGRDVDCGGARYNWIMPSFVGLSNLADAILAIKKLVFDERKVTMADYARALGENYEGHEALYLEILNRVPKYGNDIDEADSQLPEITSWILEETAKHKTWRGDRFIPSLFCWVMHEYFGTNTAATPDGRKSGFPLGDGSGPAQGREVKGPTASVLSSTKWQHEPFIGGIAVNLKFSKSMLGKNSLENMAALVKTYMQRGGFEVQINVVDRETLLRARENPQQYRDLVVRVGGYSDFFTHLSPAMQDEVIARTTHAL
ncbi:MAG: pyruvate formate lyase family protein [Clostridia bacterium]|nr:pyruvate formate lyase family protein [Clostridia bacterium]